MFDYKKLERAVDRNIVMFDNDAKPGEFTTRHVAILKVAGRNYFRTAYSQIPARLIKLWLPKEILDQLQERDIELEEPHDNVYGEDSEAYPADTWQKFQELRGSLQSQDMYLCLAEFDNGEYLLGSF